MNDHRRMRWRPAVAAAALVLVASNCQAQQRIVADDVPAAASSCAPCHGPTGQGQQSAGIPRLAGMKAKYLEAQMLGYRNGRRSDPVMEQVAKQLDAADIATLAVHFASQPVVDDSAVTFAAASASAASATATTVAAAEGEALARRGNWKNGVPACAQCHAPDGLGVGDSFPQIAGQPAIYLANQLQAWKVRRRNTDPMGLMLGVASRLSAAEINAVAAWYAALPAAAAPDIPVKSAKPLKRPRKAASPSTRRHSKQ